VTENEYQAGLIKRLEARFPGCVVLKNDAALKQGILDLTLLYQDKWAALEVKRHINARTQPNQQFFVTKLNDMSFAAIICPENEEEVLSALEEAFSSRRQSRVSQS
jgi:hypothetical protein